MTTGFERLQVSGYRRLKNLDLPLRPFNVLIGANGVGKSSVLEVVSLLAASAEGRLAKTLSQAGGISSLLTLDGKTDSMRLGVRKLVQNGEPIDYQFSLSTSGAGYIIESEILKQQRHGSPEPRMALEQRNGELNGCFSDGFSKKIIIPNITVRVTETVLSMNIYDETHKLCCSLIGSSGIYRHLDVSDGSPVRLPQPVQPMSTPGINGESLISCLHSIRETDMDRFEAIEDTLRAVFPTFKRINLPSVAAGSLTLAWQDRNLSQPIYPHQLSEGILRFLWLVTLLQSPELPSVTLIDEPEVSLHPEMLRLLADLMREASQRTQLIVTTHSDRFVRFLKPDELVVCDLEEDGSTSVRRASDLDLDAWMADYTLDQLWSMGLIGGRS